MKSNNPVLNKVFELKIYNYWLLIAAATITLFFFAFLYKIVFQNTPNVVTIILVDVLLLVGATYLFLLFSKPKTVLKISEQGIWTKKENWIEWREVKSFYIKKTYQRGHIFLSLFLTLNNTEHEINVVISNDRIIRKYIALYKGEYDIIDIGTKEEYIKF